MKSGSSQLDVVCEFQLWKIKKLMLSRFFMKEENPKPIISETNQHRCWFEQTQENIYVSFFFVVGTGSFIL